MACEAPLEPIGYIGWAASPSNVVLPNDHCYGLIIPIALVVPGSLNHMFPSAPIAIERTALPRFRPLVNTW